MKSLSTEDANKYLNQISMEIGKWHEIKDNNKQHGQDNWIKHHAPRNSLELYFFSQHVAGWLPKGNWKVFQIDNSTYLDPDELYLFGRLLFGSQEIPDLNFAKNNTFFFEFGNNEDENDNIELLISNLIFVFLLFECHGYIVSSNSKHGEKIGIQDGFVIFSSRKRNISNEGKLLKKVKENPLCSPKLMVRIMAKQTACV